MRQFVARLGRLPVTPFAIPILACIPLWIENFPRISYQMVLPTVLGLLSLAALLLVGIWLAARDWARASLIASIWIGFLLYLPSPIRVVTESRWVMSGAIVIGAALAWDMSRRVLRETGRFRRANGIANLLSGLPAFVMVGALIIQQQHIERGRPDPRDSFAAFPGQANAQSPDVWHIVMDRYAGASTLSRSYGFDNKAFLSALRERGFTVADDAYANYQITPLSLASTLNASYLDAYTPRLGNQNDIVPMFRAIDKNAAFDFFRRQGYEVIFAGGWADVTNDNSQADRKIEFRRIGELPRTVVNQSVPGVLAQMLGMPYADGRGDQCLRAKYKFDRLREVAGEPARKYVFAHFLVPHPPYVVKADGTCQSVSEAQELGRVRSYIEQIEFSNRELLRLIDTILKGPRPATIVLHADEGPYPATYAVDEPEFPQSPKPGMNYLTDTAEVRREKTGIVLAVRHADGTRGQALRSPVNIYPVITNHSFGTNIPLRRDRTLMFGAGPNYRELRDVTSETFGAAR
ncbi:hypothetical protein GCM10011494_03080 [Novosphingobium endophyticum]|uniref:Sulfatase N-terminal domain-containing protein n=1 Tax=Novosphingobium endophyticum TaxID=1955250 RepID=A0A916TRS6_9SPHN|nr:sulfatase-like hydrolase/transferase [Novosphingobium endophyticum]GGB88173.1 hypothetical protein GCM10011494_03080 [Novosphingobium endophyticum]